VRPASVPPITYSRQPGRPSSLYVSLDKAVDLPLSPPLHYDLFSEDRHCESNSRTENPANYGHLANMLANKASSTIYVPVRNHVPVAVPGDEGPK
jgi:hypothetical protein